MFCGLMNKLTLFFSLFLFFAQLIYSQQLSGVISDENEAIIPSAHVLIKDAQNPELIVQFTSSNKNGHYKLHLKENYTEIIVEVTKFGYETQRFRLNQSELKEQFQLDVVLKEHQVELETVSIKAKPKIEVKEDTVNYTASAFLDGSERKVEDLLKKLPGIKVEDDGRIKYKGKPVERLLLEGDDLFDSNYTIGTKNINVDIVEQVQAIENFSENPLFKGIEDSEKVALNLKLKKGMVDFSGDGDFGYGMKDKHYANLNGLVITKKIKNFSTISYNNIGENFAPFDYFSRQSTNSGTKTFETMAIKPLSEESVSGSLGSSRKNHNDNWFANFSNIYKISPKLSLRLNLFHYHDELTAFRSNLAEYKFDDGTSLAIKQDFNLINKPEQYDAGIKLTWHTSKNSLLEINSNWNRERMRSYSNLEVNDSNELSALYGSKDFLQNKNCYLPKS